MKMHHVVKLKILPPQDNVMDRIRSIKYKDLKLRDIDNFEKILLQVNPRLRIHAIAEPRLKDELSWAADVITFLSTKMREIDTEFKFSNIYISHHNQLIKSGQVEKIVSIALCWDNNVDAIKNVADNVNTSVLRASAIPVYQVNLYYYKHFRCMIE